MIAVQVVQIAILALGTNAHCGGVAGQGIVLVTVGVIGTRGTASTLGGMVRLPPYGFVVEAETFVTFHALSWKGIAYDSPVLFALTSLDGRPLAEAGQVRVYHGFGDARLAWRDGTVEVQREAIV